MYALYKPPILNEPGPWYPKDTDRYHNLTIYTYMGCAVSFVDNTGCHVCYFQPDEGAVKLKLNIVSPEVNIDLESYSDSFWTQYN